MSVEKTYTCDGCGETPLTGTNHHDGQIYASGGQSIVSMEFDLCSKCLAKLRAGVKEFFGRVQ